LGPLPPGWEETHTQEGQKYYMNHITKSTQWEDPRITVSQLPLHQNNQHVAQISGGPGGSLPHGWEQGTTPEGEIYYIDHSTHRTQWHDPRIPQSQQPNIPQRINNQGTSQQRLLQLQREKKAVLDKQLELRRMAELQKHIRANSGSGLAEAQEMLMRQSLNESNGPQPNDPFLTSTQQQQQQQQQQQADLHNRQESADSGLGMGSNFNLGSIPEDISGMESMDTGDLDTTLTGDSTPTAATMNSDHMMNSLPENLPIDDDIITLLNNSQRNSAVAPASSAASVTQMDGTLTWL
jgi:protein yorkie